MRLLIAGMFGPGNFGDELFARVVTEAIAADGRFAPPLVLTTDEEVTARSAPGAEAVAASALAVQARHTSRLRERLESLDYVLIGGGALFGEAFLRTSVVQTAAIAALAYRFGVPYGFHGLGIDGLRSDINRYLASWTLRHAHQVVCRSDVDLHAAKSFGADNAELGVDLNHAWLRRNARDDGASDKLNTRLTVNLQHALSSRDAGLVSILRTYREDGFRIHWVAANPTALKVAERLYVFRGDTTEVCRTVDSEAAALRCSSHYLTQRFHHTIAALHSRGTVVTIISSTKVSTLIRQLREAGVQVETLRRNEGEDDIVRIPYSAARDRLTAGWADAAREQLKGVLGAALSARPRSTPSALERTAPIVVMNAVFAAQYLLDRVRPLGYQGV